MDLARNPSGFLQTRCAKLLLAGALHLRQQQLGFLGPACGLPRVGSGQHRSDEPQPIRERHDGSTVVHHHTKRQSDKPTTVIAIARRNVETKAA